MFHGDIRDRTRTFVDVDPDPCNACNVPILISYVLSWCRFPFLPVIPVNPLYRILHALRLAITAFPAANVAGKRARILASGDKRTGRTKTVPAGLNSGETH